MKFNPINLSDALIKAIRAGKFEIFADASVPMGEPANLPDFNFLTDRIVTGNGESKPDQVPADRFLGRPNGKASRFINASQHPKN